MPSLKPSYTCPFPTTTRVFTFSVDLSISSVPPLLLAPLWSSHSKRVPPSISFCLSSKLESLSSLFVFRRPPLHPPSSLAHATSLLPLFVLQPVPSSPPFPSTITVSFLSFLSFFEDQCFSLFSAFFSLSRSFNSRFSFYLLLERFSDLPSIKFR